MKPRKRFACTLIAALVSSCLSACTAETQKPLVLIDVETSLSPEEITKRVSKVATRANMEMMTTHDESKPSGTLLIELNNAQHSIVVYNPFGRSQFKISAYLDAEQDAQAALAVAHAVEREMKKAGAN